VDGRPARRRAGLELIGLKAYTLSYTIRTSAALGAQPRQPYHARAGRVDGTVVGPCYTAQSPSRPSRPTALTVTDTATIA